ncbi:DUF1109 domain-containing protein [Sphingomonas sp.]|uniref:DUF1109 domain-containing protein n=1 Tax=Sphingomonas sp. TaxID=28214 RepID=UPI0017B29D89|nr:DUF1109 domain-containing protein [Sphingomonas sp.]MBA3511135.1 DUF1109 domain-containing protein [Sphingomonas sp.]
MIATEDLIRNLSADLKPSRPGMASLRLLSCVVGGAVVALAGITLVLGSPLGAVGYTGIPAFTMKLAFAAAMTAASGILLLAAGRPGQQIGFHLTWLLLPLFVVAAAAVMELAITAPQLREQAWLGTTWLTCILAIVGFSLPVLGGVVWAFRRLAPTRLRLTGFLAGITSGSAAALVYALYCPETTATFLASWYTAGIVAAGLIGLLAGPRLLRW